MSSCWTERLIFTTIFSIKENVNLECISLLVFLKREIRLYFCTALFSTFRQLFWKDYIETKDRKRLRIFKHNFEYYSIFCITIYIVIQSAFVCLILKTMHSIFEIDPRDLLFFHFQAKKRGQREEICSCVRVLTIKTLTTRKYYICCDVAPDTRARFDFQLVASTCR